MRRKIAIKFGLRGNVRFLSHQETLRVFCRAFSRGGIAVSHSEGFNPHPQLSLPFPRPVGVESQEELLCVSVEGAGDAAECEMVQILKRLKEQLPDGYELLGAEVAEQGASFNPVSVTYQILPEKRFLENPIAAAAERLSSKIAKAEPIFVEREVPSKGKKNVEIGCFLEAVGLSDEAVTVRCRVSPAGTVRVDEIMKLLEIDNSMLNRPVRRASVEWSN